ncbi:hypothetical protein D3C71_901330 [compost metagenome]
MLLQRQCRVEHGFHLLLSMPLQRYFETLRPRRALFQDVLARHGAETQKQGIAAGEVGVAQHVGRDEGVFRHGIVLGHVGMARVAGKHDFEHMRVAHLLMHELVDVAHAERPVAHAHGQAIDGDLGHEAVRYQLELDGRKLQPHFLRQRFDARRVAVQVGCIRRHAAASVSAASCWKKVRMAAQISSFLLRMLLCKGKPRRSCSANKLCISVSRLRGTPGTVST